MPWLGSNWKSTPPKPCEQEELSPQSPQKPLLLQISLLLLQTRQIELRALSSLLPWSFSTCSLNWNGQIKQKGVGFFTNFVHPILYHIASNIHKISFRLGSHLCDKFIKPQRCHWQYIFQFPAPLNLKKMELHIFLSAPLSSAHMKPHLCKRSQIDPQLDHETAEHMWGYFK